MKKCAKIRGPNAVGCPFSLPIPAACKCAGGSVHRMAPVEEGDKATEKAHRLVYAYHKECRECVYADKILEKHEKVDCNYGDTGEGKKSLPYAGSPLYPSNFVGIGLDGITGYPLGYYADNNESRNLFFGLFSYLGREVFENLIKIATENGEEDKKILDILLKKVYNIKKEYDDAFEEVKKLLQEKQNASEENRIDTGKMWSLIKSWYGQRQGIR